MKFYSLDSSPYKPVSHDPDLRKRVLMEERHLCVKHISHISLEPGNSARPHIHPSESEIFYCIKGKALFKVMGKDVAMERGSCLVIEAGEEHSIDKVIEETELLYFHAISI